jgi:nitrate/TMAO reductase-like tetraheme cytochrome c subunit
MMTTDRLRELRRFIPALDIEKQLRTEYAAALDELIAAREAAEAQARADKVQKMHGKIIKPGEEPADLLRFRLEDANEEIAKLKTDNDSLVRECHQFAQHLKEAREAAVATEGKKP